ncbi:hypothetical protein FT643_08715 [Ketobacter sp. MCCC 1A13808]|nr:hypothetical protein [Ketobacter sp. MCCC 1A13808]
MKITHLKITSDLKKMSDNSNVAHAAGIVFQKYMELYDEVEVVSLATTDGFPVQNQSRESISFDIDTMAAASSTLYSVSNAVSKQILSKHFKITFIEAEQGNIAFVSLSFDARDFVLAMSATESMNIGKVRVLINRLAEDIRQQIQAEQA